MCVSVCVCVCVWTRCYLWCLQDGYIGLGGWLVRDMPYDFITMQENILDPAHTMFAHHGLLGTREDATAFGMRPKQALTLDNGFSLAVDSSTRKYKVRPHSTVTTAHIRALSFLGGSRQRKLVLRMHVRRACDEAGSTQVCT